jgi:hypothetical protein
MILPRASCSDTLARSQARSRETTSWVKDRAVRPFLSHRGLQPQHQLVGLIGRHKKVPYLSVGMSITMILRSRSQQEVRMSAEAPKAAVEDLIAKVVGGKALEAFDRY